MIGYHMYRPVIAEIIAIDLHQPGVRTAPGSHGRSAGPDDDHRFCTWLDVVWAIPFGYKFVPPFNGRHANHIPANLQSKGLDFTGNFFILCRVHVFTFMALRMTTTETRQKRADCSRGWWRQHPWALYIAND